MDLVLLQYKNYFNREAKKESSLQGYYDAAKKVYFINEYDFNPNDGINTSAVIGGEDYDINDAYDYLIVVSNGEIHSRWFIMDARRTRVGQYTLTLKRDVIVDNWDNIVSAPMMIEKATVTDDSPAIYNQEAVLTNQIKTSETLLSDHNTAYIALYMSPNAYKEAHPIAETEQELQARTLTFNAMYFADVIINSDLQDWTYYTKLNTNIKKFKNLVYETPIIGDHNYNGRFITSYMNAKHNLYNYNFEVENMLRWRFTGTFTYPVRQFASSVSDNDSQISYLSMNEAIISNVIRNTTTTDIDQYKTLQYESDFDNLYDILKYYDNKIVQFNNGLFKFKVTYNSNSSKRTTYKNNIGDTTLVSDIKDALDQFAGTNRWVNEHYDQVGIGQIVEYYENFVVSYTSIDGENKTYEVVIPTPEPIVGQVGHENPGRLHLKDAPYDMAIIPVNLSNPFRFVVQDTEQRTETYLPWQNKISIISIAQGIAKAAGSNLYDVQLLPYAPIGNYLCGDNYFELLTTKNASLDNARKTVIRSKRYVDGETIYTDETYMIWCLASSGVKTINVPEIGLINKKIQNQTDLYRISSGNYSSSFEINPSKNGGIKNFKVDYTYVPYNPYYRVYPEFNNLYGGEFKDCRGLVDQSDKSISYLSDAWTQYQIQNKTYQQQFDRQIQNMEVNQNIKRVNEGINAAVNIGAQAVRKNWVGAGMETLKTAQNVISDEVSYAEKVDYTKDMFYMNLANIKALPNTIAKMTAYNEDNKVFPILEYYTCTDEEKNALANKIKYNGMTVNSIGTINDYINNVWSYGLITDKGFIKGQLIQAQDIADDQHMVDSIANELYKGIYTKW